MLIDRNFANIYHVLENLVMARNVDNIERCRCSILNILYTLIHTIDILVWLILSPSTVPIRDLSKKTGRKKNTMIGFASSDLLYYYYCY